MAARSIWKGSLSVGLINLPVALYVATDEASSGTARRQLHKACFSPINQKKHCAKCAVDVATADVVHGVEQPDKTFVLVSDEEVAGLKTATTHTIGVEHFVPADAIDPLFVDNTYYLAPQAGAAAAFALLREAMRTKDVVMTARLVLYGRERAVAVRPLERFLALELLRSQTEIRTGQELPGYDELDKPIDQAQLGLAGQLLDLYAGSFDATAYEDTFASAFRALVESKRTGEPVVVPAGVTPPPPALDFMAALQASLAAKAPAPAKVAVAVAAPAAAPAKAKGKGKKSQAA